ncbi:Multiple epidermal growth factor-like domains protein 8 [Lunasporangiospora selenospora]|uniref:Multiple epidermal growth factor-like domains protein 8 n=1 Tax=Lunasporangiospora selenospora TaxID=979761 RepID=A0A9P6FYY2_9FUNG|nr:Multiple epidermal growth factor-like domains protein 8 [Lunasporangiospora selenospora]
MATTLLALAAFSFASIDGFPASSAATAPLHPSSDSNARTTPESKSGSATNLKLYYTNSQEPVPVTQTSGSNYPGPGSLFGILLRSARVVFEGLNRQKTLLPFQHSQLSLEDENKGVETHVSGQTTQGQDWKKRPRYQRRVLSLNDNDDENNDEEDNDGEDSGDDDNGIEDLGSDEDEIDINGANSSSRSSNGVKEFTIVSRMAPAPNMINPATTQCDSTNLQQLGPGWNGTFASNSPDGAYLPETKDCTWTIQALNSTTGGVHGVPYIVAINFTTPIQLICGTDYLTLYDGPDTSSPILAKICGNIWVDRIPTFYSTGPQLTAVFSSLANSPGTYGFTASWSSVDTAGYKDFTPRSQHAMVYDPSKEMVYIMGGRSLRNPYMWDLLTYSFESNKWNKITLNTKSPEPRYGHFGFIYKDDLYVYGGVSVIGALSDIWKFNGKTWTQQQPINPDQLPNGRVGSACVVVTNNNSTKLYVFGGISVTGATTRELYTYDIDLAMWKRSGHQNSVGLAGATAVYHKATDSIYYFGGMINHATRNVVTYQYRISQDLWYALAPRVDPFTNMATPWTGNPPLGLPSHSPLVNNGTNSENSDGGGDDDDDETGTAPMQNATVQYYPPVLYDQVSAVWAPAGLMDDDTVVIFGGMRPYGPGITNRDQTCYLRSFAIYDLSCQKWTTYETSQLSGSIRGRVNHTMILRPPGSAGGNKTAWTAYIFGGFDGSDHADVISVPLSIPTTTSATINSCRALRWCSLYDDCQYCNPSYCSYVNGLCLFDLEKAKDASLLAGNYNDAPRTGTLQELIRQRPEFKNQIESCPSRIGLDLSNPFSGTIQSGQEQTFRIYIDALDYDIQFEIRSLPASSLNFKSLNVWEGFMNMYWRASHSLTDDTWNGTSGTSAPIPKDVPSQDNMTVRDLPVITTSGTLNTSELMNRWTKYAGLDGSSSSSALTGDSTYVYFPASDPRRIAGYYVFSLTNPSPTAVQYSVTVTLLDHPTPTGKPTGNKFNMATLGFFMIGFILAVVLLIVMARKIRQLIDDRDASQRAIEMQLIDDDDETGSGRRGHGGNGLDGGMTMIQLDGSALAKKPFYRIVVGVQDLGKDVHCIPGLTLRHRNPRRKHGGHGDGGLENTAHAVLAVKGSNHALASVAKQQLKTVTPRSSISRSMSETAMVPPSTTSNHFGPKQHEGKGSSAKFRRSRVKSDYIRDIGSAPLPMLMSEPDQKLPVLPNFSLSSPALTNGFTPEKTELHSQKAPALQSPPLQLSVPGSESRQISRQSSKSSKREPGETGQAKTKEENATLLSTHAQDGDDSPGLQRGWSLRGLGRVASLRRSNTFSSRKVSPEEELLTSNPNQGMPTLGEESKSPNALSIDTRVSSPAHSFPNGYDSEQEMVDLSVLASPTDLLKVRNEQLEKLERNQHETMGHTDTKGPSSIGGMFERRLRNPARVQPISIEPLSFHAGLVPRTLAHFRRFQQALSRNRRRQRKHQLMILKQQQQQQQMQMQMQQMQQGFDDSNNNSSRSVNSVSSNVDPLSTQVSRFIGSQLNSSSRSMVASRNHPTVSLSSSIASSTLSGQQQQSRKPQESEQVPSRRKRLQSKNSQGSLREIHLKAARITSRTKGDSSSSIRLQQTLELNHTVVDMDPSSEQGPLDQTRNNTPITSSVAESRPSPSPFKHTSQMTKDTVLLAGGPSAASIKSENIKVPQATPKRKPIKMRGRQEYEPGPLLAVNILIVFPGDSGSRRVRQQGEDEDKYYSRKETNVVSTDPDRNPGTTLSGNHSAEQTFTPHHTEGSEAKQDQIHHTKSEGEEEQEDALDDSNLYSQERRLPPMAIGTVFVPDPVRWWAYRAKLQQDRQKYERELRQLQKQQQQEPFAPPSSPPVRKGYFRSKPR